MNKHRGVLVLFCLKDCKKEYASSPWARVSAERHFLLLVFTSCLMCWLKGVSSQTLAHLYFSEILHSNGKTSARDPRNLGCTDWYSPCEGCCLRNNSAFTCFKKKNHRSPFSLFLEQLLKTNNFFGKCSFHRSKHPSKLPDVSMILLRPSQWQNISYTFPCRLECTSHK